MQDEPAELPVDVVLAHVRRGWELSADRVRYVPVGAGSYHWVAEAGGRPGWFVKGDVVPSEGAFTLLRSTFDTAAALHGGGLEFVVAPVPDREGALLRSVASGWAMSVFPYLQGDPIGVGPWPADASARTRAAGLFGRLHAAAVPAVAPRWTPDEAVVSGVLLPDLEQPWGSGPFAEPARRRLIEALADIERLRDHYLSLLKRLDAEAAPWVVTHGEPHSANVIETHDGRLLLIDWDSLRVAPREREFRHHLPLHDDSAALEAYAANAGTTTIRPWVCDLFRAEWDLHEIGWFSSRLRATHTDTADAQQALERLTDYLEVERHWPDL